VETARHEVRRQKLLHFLESKNPAWKDQAHPELARGAAAWVRRLRTDSEARGTPPQRPKKRARTQAPRTH
jgi:hypothetical protein